jgi:integration host factor subunit alpha
MTKAEIVQALYTRVGGFSKKESADIVDLVFEMMKETLGRGEKIKISGFGNFVLRDKRQRPGRNPQTGDPIKISERRVLTFKASQILKQALNAKEKDKNGGGMHVPNNLSPGMGSGSGLAADQTGARGAGSSSGGMNVPLAAASEAPKE